MTTPAEADVIIGANMPAAAVESVPLTGAAGRILAATAFAERDQPPFDRATMDGIAIRYGEFASGLREFRVAGTIAAGVAAAPAIGPRACVEIMTGAAVPAAVDTVIPVERITRNGEFANVAADARVESGQFIHPRGSDNTAGQELLPPGVRLGAAEIAVLASSGYATVDVAATPSVAIVSTGDELVGLDEPVAPHQIRSSNDHAIAAALRRHGFDRIATRRLRDDEEELIDSIASLHAGHDALILSGGVSMGQFDFVPMVLETLGCEVKFHKIEQKPGRPMWFGVSGAGKPVFALPGNPVSTLLCMTRYVVPAFERAAGMPARPGLRYPLSAAVRGPVHMTYFVPVVLVPEGAGSTVAEPHPTNTSGDFATLARTDGFLELPPGMDERPAGYSGTFISW